MPGPHGPTFRGRRLFPLGIGSLGSNANSGGGGASHWLHRNQRGSMTPAPELPPPLPIAVTGAATHTSAPRAPAASPIALQGGSEFGPAIALYAAGPPPPPSPGSRRPALVNQSSLVARMATTRSPRSRQLRALQLPPQSPVKGQPAAAAPPAARLPLTQPARPSPLQQIAQRGKLTLPVSQPTGLPPPSPSNLAPPPPTAGFVGASPRSCGSRGQLVSRLRRERHSDGMASPALSPSARACARLAARRVWFAGVPIKMRPTVSNLRPLERVTRRSDGGGEPFVAALALWDVHWRLYLHKHYDDALMLRLPKCESDARKLQAQRCALDRMATDLFALKPGPRNDHPPTNKHGVIISTPAIEFVSNKLEARKQKLADVLNELLRLIKDWTKVEEARWAAPPGGEPVASADDPQHEEFCNHVEKIDVYQRKFKSVSDGVRRLRKKQARLVANEAEAQQNAGAASSSSSDRAPPPRRTAAATGPSGAYGDATPHPGAGDTRRPSITSVY